VASSGMMSISSFIKKLSTDLNLLMKDIFYIYIYIYAWTHCYNDAIILFVLKNK
jgi:hypothetical protein